MTRRYFKVGFCLLAMATVLNACSKKEESAGAAAASAPADASAPATPAPSASAPPAASGTDAEVLPGQNAVRSALKAKNYSGAATQLLAMKNGLPAEMW